MPEERRFFAPQAWVAGRWVQDVLLMVNVAGCWSQVRVDCPAEERADAQGVSGPLLPGLVDAHSHALQRVIAGLAERSEHAHDDFWTWRDRMYTVALRITPQQLETIATFLYGELLQAGYTQVCEFHYLHNHVDGRPYADPLEMSLALVRAARNAGIGLTLLPTLYMRSGFGASGLREDQRRFASTPESVLRIAEAVRKLGEADPLRLTAGVALHSLRAVDEGALRETAQAARAAGMPVHIHVGEQQLEVDHCLRQHGERPVEWLLHHVTLDPSWNLVHATHANGAELAELQRTGAAIVLCPSTEANLGDGVFDFSAWLRQHGTWSIGSDSHVTRSWMEELRLLEYTQRLRLHQRNVAAHGAGQPSTAAVLFEGALQGGAAAAGLPLRGLRVGERADFMVLDPTAAALVAVPVESTLDAAVFSSPNAQPAVVGVAGQQVQTRQDTAAYAAVQRELW